MDGAPSQQKTSSFIVAPQQREAGTAPAARGRTEEFTTWRQLFQQKDLFLARYAAVLQFLSSISCMWQRIRLLDNTQVIHVTACGTSHAHTWMAEVLTAVTEFLKKEKKKNLTDFSGPHGPEGTSEDSLIPMCKMQKTKLSPSFAEAKNCCPESKLQQSSYYLRSFSRHWVGSVCALFQLLGKMDTHCIDASFFVTP